MLYNLMVDLGCLECLDKYLCWSKTAKINGGSRPVKYYRFTLFVHCPVALREMIVMISSSVFKL